MKIKSFILSLVFTSSITLGFAQKAELNNAVENYDKYGALRGNKIGVPMLKAAKESIDKAILNDKTSVDAKTWAYRALIYAELASLETSDSKAKPSITVAMAAAEKANQLDTKGEQKSNLQNVNRILYNYALNMGVNEYKAQNYSKAYTAFNEASTLMPGDTTTTYYAGISAMYGKDYPNAITKYNQLLNTKYSLLEDVYSNLSILYANQKDTASAIRIAGEGAAKFPKNGNLAKREIEFSLMTGKEKEVISKITAQAEREPTSKIYPYYLGLAYAASKDYVKAEESYKKALAIDPVYSDALINLGGLVMNNGIELYNKAIKVDYVVKGKIIQTKFAESNALKKKATAEFDRSLPYLQKAVDVTPSSKIALDNLRRYYVITNNNSKAAEIQKKIDAIN